jgi:hypothetical protein
VANRPTIGLFEARRGAANKEFKTALRLVYQLKAQGEKLGPMHVEVLTCRIAKLGRRTSRVFNTPPKNTSNTLFMASHEKAVPGKVGRS